ncbi:hypothetical protein PsYK624_073970 [Phanerochaete sordida]|uniref:C2H2-type domain-containing protein n=1 Tax=Phanerochaete sordida TaxID=48140 RepID=A0A9P3G8D9_9APHY|nr:hypothetical protein PsYK624_073970 [Phanerochaete sordida]
MVAENSSEALYVVNTRPLSPAPAYSPACIFCTFSGHMSPWTCVDCSSKRSRASLCFHFALHVGAMLPTHDGTCPKL